MSGRPSGRNATLINRSGGAQTSKAEQLFKAAHASGQQSLNFGGRAKSARIAEAASAPEADSRSPVEIAEAEADAADAASKKAHAALFLAQNSVMQLKKECRTAVHHHKATCSLLETLRRGEFEAPPSDIDAGLQN
jgi:hypothetical protein